MKKNIILALFALLFFSVISYAQDLDLIVPVPEDSTVIQEPAKKKGLIQWFKRWRDNTLRAGIDTNYIQIPKQKWLVTTGFKTSRSTSQIYWPNATEMADEGNPGHIFDNFESAIYKYTSKPTLAVSIGLAYKGFGLTISPKIVNTNKAKGLDIGLGLTGVTFGGDFTVRMLFDYDSEGNEYLLANSSLSAYYVLNHDKYNMSAAFSQSVLQKKSAGSVIFATQLGFSAIDAVETKYNSIRNGSYGTFGMWSIGVGYGYNFVFAQSRCLIHASYIPAFMILQGSRYGMYDPNDPEKKNRFVRSDDAFAIPYAHMARFAFYYTWRDRYIFGGSLQDSHYGWEHSETRPNFASEWTAQLFFKFRF